MSGQSFKLRVTANSNSNTLVSHVKLILSNMPRLLKCYSKGESVVDSVVQLHLHSLCKILSTLSENTTDVVFVKSV